MKLLLCSDFSGVGCRYIKKFFKNLKNKTCLFVGYAQEDDNEEESSSAKFFINNGINTIFLDKNYKFCDKIDMVFVRGGNTTRLLDYLHKYNQFEKIRQLILNDVLYIGNSAGSIIVGTETEYTLESEPYEYDLKKKYGENALLGYGLIPKMIFVHASKYRLCRDYEMANQDDIFRTLDTDCYPAYLDDIKKYNKNQFIKIANNQVLYKNGEYEKIITFDWRKIPVKI